jgi:hypothetical protein
MRQECRGVCRLGWSRTEQPGRNACEREDTGAGGQIENGVTHEISSTAANLPLMWPYYCAATWAGWPKSVPAGCEIAIFSGTNASRANLALLATRRDISETGLCGVTVNGSNEINQFGGINVRNDRAETGVAGDRAF